MTQKEIFGEIAVSIIEILPPNQKFKEAILNIMRLEGTVELTGYYIDEFGVKKWLDIFNIKLNSNYIHELYSITQTQQPIHINWNKAIFTLYSDNKVNIQYVWDDELQREVDRLNNEN